MGAVCNAWHSSESTEADGVALQVGRSEAKHVRGALGKQTYLCVHTQISGVDSQEKLQEIYRGRSRPSKASTPKVLPGSSSGAAA